VVYCAVPPLDQAATRIGRGYGVGYNRDRSSRDQLHGGMDFVADAGTPILAPAPGIVALVSHDSGPGRARGMGGYGNAVVLEHRFNVPGLPNPFWTGYMHLRNVPTLRVGDPVNTGTLLGLVGNTTNGQFRGMGAHLHHELRVRPYPGSYDRDTRDPAILYRGLGIDYVGARREVERMVGGQLLVRTGGESDCRAGQIPVFAGLSDLFGLGSVPAGYVDPALLRAKYSAHGTSGSHQNVETVLPPDYSFDEEPAAGSSSGGGLLVAGAAFGLGLALLFRRRP
jgi:murein DD-endopeptidase MepM/ murein hydrolase activator NlpD